MSRQELIISIILVGVVLAGGVIFQKAQAPGYLDKPYFKEKILFDTYVFIKAYERSNIKSQAPMTNETSNPKSQKRPLRPSSLDLVS